MPLKNSVALRSPAFGSKGGQSGAIVDVASNRILLTESSNEKKVIKTLLADREVTSVREQAARIAYLGSDGEWHEHVIDVIAETKFENIAYLVKDEHGAAKKGLRGFAENLARHIPKSVADRVDVRTSRDLVEWHTQNAGLIVNARRERRTHIDDALRELAPTLTTPIRIGDLSDRLGGGALAFRPIVRALHYGTLKYLAMGRIDVNSKVVFSGEVKEDTDLLGPSVDETQSEPPVFRRPKKKARTKVRASRRTS